MDGLYYIKMKDIRYDVHRKVLSLTDDQIVQIINEDSSKFFDLYETAITEAI